MNIFLVILVGFSIFGCSNLNVKTKNSTIKNNSLFEEPNVINISIIDNQIEYFNLKNKTNMLKSISFFRGLENSSYNVSLLSQFDRLSELNNYFNSNFNYKKDEDTYGMNDYWASIYEMIQSGFNGDCEDFTFAKIQLADMYNIDKKDIFIGFTKNGKHIFPIFFDGINYIVSDTNGKLKTLESYIKKYPDLNIYSYAEIWTTKDFIFRSNKKYKTLVKVTGLNI